MSIPFWVGHYMRIPYLRMGRDAKGLDDYGIIRLVYAEQYGYTLPLFNTPKCDAELKAWLFKCPRTTKPKMGDIARLPHDLYGLYFGDSILTAQKGGTCFISSKGVLDYFRYKNMHNDDEGWTG